MYAREILETGKPVGQNGDDGPCTTADSTDVKESWEEFCISNVVHGRSQSIHLEMYTNEAEGILR